MWLGDAFTHSPLAVFVAGLVSFEALTTLGRREARIRPSPRYGPKLDLPGGPPRWKGVAWAVALIALGVGLAILLDPVGRLLGIAATESEDGPIESSVDIWRVLLALYATFQAGAYAALRFQPASGGGPREQPTH